MLPAASIAQRDNLMTAHAAGIRRLDGIIWALVAGVAGLVLLAALLLGFQVAWHSFVGPAGTAVLLLAGQWFYLTRRPDPRLAGALGTTAQITAFAAVGAPLSYLGAATNLPLFDRWFDSADRALGLDWSGMLAWMDTHAALHPLFREIYMSLMPQTVVVVLALAWAGRQSELRNFVLAFILATLTTIVLAALIPAEGVWGYYNLHATEYPNIAPAAHGVHLPMFNGLRDGSFRMLMATGAEGIITFPSLHAALAVILIAALWPLPAFRWIGLAINTVMLVSIPIDGGHYFIDIFAGLVIAVLSLYAARRLTARHTTHFAPAKAAEPVTAMPEIAVR